MDGQRRVMCQSAVTVVCETGVCGADGQSCLTYQQVRLRRGPRHGGRGRGGRRGALDGRSARLLWSEERPGSRWKNQVRQRDT